MHPVGNAIINVLRYLITPQCPRLSPLIPNPVSPTRLVWCSLEFPSATTPSFRDGSLTLRPRRVLSSRSAKRWPTAAMALTRWSYCGSAFPQVHTSVSLPLPNRLAQYSRRVLDSRLARYLERFKEPTFPLVALHQDITAATLYCAGADLFNVDVSLDSPLSRQLGLPFRLGGAGLRDPATVRTAAYLAAYRSAAQYAASDRTLWECHTRRDTTTLAVTKGG